MQGLQSMNSEIGNITKNRKFGWYFEMKCGCGAEYRVDEHPLGYSIRCENWIWHKQNPNKRMKS